LVVGPPRGCSQNLPFAENAAMSSDGVNCHPHLRKSSRTLLAEFILNQVDRQLKPLRAIHAIAKMLENDRGFEG
jgi:hypothetical protein